EWIYTGRINADQSGWVLFRFNNAGNGSLIYSGTMLVKFTSRKKPTYDATVGYTNLVIKNDPVDNPKRYTVFNGALYETGIQTRQGRPARMEARLSVQDKLRHVNLRLDGVQFHFNAVTFKETAITGRIYQSKLGYFDLLQPAQITLAGSISFVPVYQYD